METITKEKLEEAIKDIFFNREYKDGVSKFEGVSPLGHPYSGWRISYGGNTMYTNDAGLEQFNNTVREAVFK